MPIEIEAKFLGVNVDAVRATLKDAGAELVYPERLMRRRNFRRPDDSPRQWFRVRDEGDGKVTLAFKRMKDRTLHGTEELEIAVGDFDATCGIFFAAGMKPKSYQETKREAWSLGGCQVTLDTWPWIQPLAEVEGPSEEAVKQAAALLGLSWNTATHGSVEVAYTREYGITEEEFCAIPEVKFSETPDWLKAKRKQ